MAQRGIECGSSARSRASRRAGRRAGVEQEQGGAARLVRARRPASAAARTVAEARRRPACSATQRRAHGRAGQWAEAEQEQGCSVRLAQARAGRQALRRTLWPGRSGDGQQSARQHTRRGRRGGPHRLCGGGGPAATAPPAPLASHPPLPLIIPLPFFLVLLGTHVDVEVIWGIEYALPCEMSPNLL